MRHVYTLETEDHTQRSDDGVHGVYATLERAQQEANELNAYGDDLLPDLEWKETSDTTWKAMPAESDITWWIYKREVIA